MNVLVGLLVCCLFHARSARLNKRFNQREAKQRALCSRVLPALNTFAAIGHEQSVVVMAALCSFCLSRFGGKLLLSRCLLVHYQRRSECTPSVHYPRALLRSMACGMLKMLISINQPWPVPPRGKVPAAAAPQRHARYVVFWACSESSLY